MDQLEYAKLLVDHVKVVMFVRPLACTGLDDFADHDALRLDVGRALVPPMYPEVHPEGLHCYASFGGITRCVYVPWTAIIWAGSDDEFARLRGVAKPPPASPALRVVPARSPKSNVIRVDFKRRARA